MWVLFTKCLFYYLYYNYLNNVGKKIMNRKSTNNNEKKMAILLEFINEMAIIFFLDASSIFG